MTQPFSLVVRHIRAQHSTHRRIIDRVYEFQFLHTFQFIHLSRIKYVIEWHDFSINYSYKFDCIFGGELIITCF